MTSKADRDALLRLENFLHLYRDRAGSACPGSVPITWAALRRVVALAGKEARRERGAGEQEPKGARVEAGNETSEQPQAIRADAPTA